MPIDRYRRDGDLDHDVARPRAAPRCYMRPARSEVVSSRIGTQSIVPVLVVSIWCIAAFLIVGSGARF